MAADNENKNDTRLPVSRRWLLRDAVAGVTGIAMLVSVGVGKARAAKFTQRAVFYRPRPSLGQKCSNCLLFRRPHACRDVAGYISPDGWCVIWRDG